MSLYFITDAFGKLGSPGVKNDDFYDRLSRRYSIILLGVSFVIISSSQFIGHPINCYTQNMAGHATYVDWVCWISSSYYLPFDKPLPNRYEKPPEKIPYYQWVPFILLCMMFLFYVPGFVWRSLNRACGINTKIITKMVTNMDQLDGEKREDAVRALAKHVDKALAYHREYEYGLMHNIRQRVSSILCCSSGRHSGNYLAFTYVCVKLLYIGNAIGQLFLLNVFMGHGFSLIGFEVMKRWWNDQDSDLVDRFPRITICKFHIRTLGDNIQPYDVQCLLPINIYNEKVFMVIWFWLVFVSIASIYGLIIWLYYFTSSARMNFVQRFLQANEVRYSKTSAPRLMMRDEHDDHNPIKRLEDFVDNYCRQDGLLLLRIIKKNTNNVITGEVICALWNNWKMLPQIRFNTSLESDNGGQIIGLGVKSPMKQKNLGEVSEKLLPPM